MSADKVRRLRKPKTGSEYLICPKFVRASGFLENTPCNPSSELLLPSSSARKYPMLSASPIPMGLCHLILAYKRVLPVSSEPWLSKRIKKEKIGRAHV